jgi:hypothetical protein
MERGETNVVSVLTPLQRIRMGFYRPYEVNITVPFNGHFIDGGSMWDKCIRVQM